MLALLALLPLSVARSLSERPVSKVVTMLKEMQETLLKEQKEDEEVYDELQGWCKARDMT